MVGIPTLVQAGCHVICHCIWQLTVHGCPQFSVPVSASVLGSRFSVPLLLASLCPSSCMHKKCAQDVPHRECLSFDVARCAVEHKPKRRCLHRELFEDIYTKKI